jgi:hemoglobin
MSFNKQQSPSLFDRLGGPPAVRAAIEGMYERIMADDQLNFFFEGTTLGALKIHQLRFFKMAFTSFPPDMDVATFLIAKHEALFRDKGLTGKHFDLVAGHFVNTLLSLNVPSALVEEAATVVLSLREIFDQGAHMFGSQEGQNKNISTPDKS